MNLDFKPISEVWKESLLKLSLSDQWEGWDSPLFSESKSSKTSSVFWANWTILLCTSTWIALDAGMVDAMLVCKRMKFAKVTWKKAFRGHSFCQGWHLARTRLPYLTPLTIGLGSESKSHCPSCFLIQLSGGWWGEGGRFSISTTCLFYFFFSIIVVMPPASEFNYPNFFSFLGNYKMREGD